ncbi:RagB/SusD family nutrient uptake outer membrane protein [Flavobacteriaceae bacterium 14752]|uniref:RagB/SusD family nutrient uptake outer membrane protein n=1 Tax=Mesohalobacter salilacus TaxID=2491711 RepID=UPI000F63E965|nr:RagB/SusD family nutrient uptake outer membrane protein [Flavobacteriaceae bacterium 14752]
MKKIFLILFVTTILLSCAEQINRTPNDVLINETAFETVDDIEAAVNGIYTTYNPNNILDLSDIFTDNSRLGKDNGGQKINILNQVLNTQTGFTSGIWVNRYSTANNCNRVIEAAELVTVQPNEQERLDNLLAQAYGLRALMHYDVLALYGEDTTDPNALGIPYQDFVSATDAPTRLTTQESVNRILDDLDTASALLDDDFADVNQVTEDFITFLRARVALITNDWDGVITNTTIIIDKFPLANQTQYQAMFTGDQDQTEVIFKYDNLNGFNRNIAGEFIFTGTGGNFIGMAEGLFDLLETESIDNNDIRFETFTREDDAPDETSINKYPAIAGTFINDFKLFRASEAYLMRAEAFARLTQFQNAADDIQAIRNARRGTTASANAYSSLVNAIEDIAFERRLELCFEGHRYLDLKRYRNILNEGIIRDPRDCDGNIPCSLPVNDRSWVLPIPQVETNGNPNIQQNPEWL